MSDMAGFKDLVDEIKAASESVEKSDRATQRRIEVIEGSVNDLYRRAGRPGADSTDDCVFERKDAIGLCHNRRSLTVPKIDAGVSDDYQPTSTEIDEALAAKRGLKAYLRHGDTSRLDPVERKSLSAFSFGSSPGFLLPPEQSNRVLRCIVDPTDVSGLVDRVTISSGSIRFPIDNSRRSIGGWACDASCFTNNPVSDLSEGLGTLEIKTEPLRYVQCATADLLQDAAFNVEQWLIDKVSRGFRDTINAAIVAGDGVGKPLGFLHPNAGIPTCDVSTITPAGQFTLADPVMLKFEIPMAWQEPSFL